MQKIIWKGVNEIKRYSSFRARQNTNKDAYRIAHTVNINKNQKNKERNRTIDPKNPLTRTQPMASLGSFLLKQRYNGFLVLTEQNIFATLFP